IISLDGADQETYNKYRINGNLDKVLDNVRNLVAAKKKLKSKTPFLVWQFIIMKHNEFQVDSIRKMALDIGVDELQLKTVQIYDEEDIEKFLPENPAYRRYKVTDNKFVLKSNIKNRCRRLWTQPVINWDGEIAVCCYDKDNLIEPGNIGEQKFIDIWKNDKYRKFRQIILNKRASVEMCSNCGEGINLEIENEDF
ncbi:MAG: SPASM domain-containing protein, partial [Candidatus Cloacimonetes bacterium]|nr:SPASM domain-containing protein [Candidatus Cloacimonadota bacterium]